MKMRDRCNGNRYITNRANYIFKIWDMTEITLIEAIDHEHEKSEKYIR